MKRFVTTTAIALTLAAPVMASQGYVNDGVTPPREYERMTVGGTVEADAQTTVMTDKVFDPRDAALIDQERVNQYIFEDEGQTADNGDYRSPAARYR